MAEYHGYPLFQQQQQQPNAYRLQSHTATQQTPPHAHHQQQASQASQVQAPSSQSQYHATPLSSYHSQPMLSHQQHQQQGQQQQAPSSVRSAATTPAGRLQQQPQPPQPLQSQSQRPMQQYHQSSLPSLHHLSLSTHAHSHPQAFHSNPYAASSAPPNPSHSHPHHPTQQSHAPHSSMVHAAHMQNAPLYQYLVPMEVRAPGKEPCRAHLTLSVSACSASSSASSSGSSAAPHHHAQSVGMGMGLGSGRAISLQLHQESDPYFLYSALLCESEYPRLKAAQNLNVDFSQLALEIEAQLAKVEGSRKMEGNNGAGASMSAADGGQNQQQQQQQQQGYEFGVGDAHNSSGIISSFVSSASSPSSSSNSSLSIAPQDMMVGQLLLQDGGGGHGGQGGGAEFKLVYRHNFRNVDILTLHFVRASETHLKRFMVEGWGAEKGARIALESELSRVRSYVAGVEAGLEEARARLATIEGRTESSVQGVRLQCESEVLEERERHARDLAERSRAHEAALASLGAEWGSKNAALQSKLDELAAAHQQLQGEKSALHTKHSLLVVEHQHLQSEAATLRSERGQLRAENREQEDRLASQAATAQSAALRLAQLEASLKEKEGFIALSSASQSREASGRALVEENLVATKKALAHAQEKNAALVAELNRGNDALAKLQSKVKAGKDKVARARTALESAETTLRAREDMIKETVHETATLRRDLAQSTAERERLLTELKAAHKQLSDAAAQLDKSDKMVAFLNGEVNKQQSGGGGLGLGLGLGAAGKIHFGSGVGGSIAAGGAAGGAHSFASLYPHAPPASHSHGGAFLSSLSAAAGQGSGVGGGSNGTPSPGSVSVSTPQHSAPEHSGLGVGAGVGASLSKSTRALLAQHSSHYVPNGYLRSQALVQPHGQQQQQHNAQGTDKENAFSPAPFSQQHSSSTTRVPLSSAHSRSNQVYPAGPSHALHKPASTPRDDLSLYAPTAQTY